MGGEEPSDTILITNLPLIIDDTDIGAVFEQYGHVVDAKVRSANGQSEHKAATVRFASVAEAQWVVENLHGNIPAGLEEPINISFDGPKPSSKAASSYGKAATKRAAARPSPYDRNGASPSAPAGQEGIVKAWHDDKGMGFITPANGGEDLFVHRSALLDGTALVPGARVAYEEGWDERKNKPMVGSLWGANGAGASGAAPPPPRGGGWMASAGAASMLRGTVKAWVEEKGMGFITPANGGEDIFVHRTALMDASSLVPGALILYEEGWDQRKNKPIVSKCQDAGAIPRAPPPPRYTAPVGPPVGAPPRPAPPVMHHAMTGANGAPLLRGTVKAWKEQNGMGFITPAGGGEDIFVHRTALVDGMSLVPGALVLYEEGWDQRKDKPIVKMCQDAGAHPQPSRYGGPPPPAPAYMSHASSAMLGSAKRGTVKAWVDAKGMGFITPADGGEDIFVHRTALFNMMGLMPGTLVLYEEGWDRSKNKPIVTKCEDAGAHPHAQGSRSSVTLADVRAISERLNANGRIEQRPGKGSGKSKTADMPRLLPREGPEEVVPGPQEGTVKAWYDAKGMGFITPGSGAPDIFVHRTALTDGNVLTEGLPVIFEEGWDERKQKKIVATCTGAMSR
eukprot:gnl/TRDRNA2_/TRDRNA2_36265_c0_seq1.p1 gnl/TRDRNA2_/TRDRNA2_36265_c0~~gnl/TRDRNA2_/TRDRNA2_36265_c0_seq1.p1  ORF type:complete len:638 (+),score=121.64 gnl/TRDRNA2_/TRDRNA2_36265_c0_seq1:50-1915(+)